jgi:hypothetical protein
MGLYRGSLGALDSLGAEVKDGMIFEDSEFGKTIGFTKDRFSGVLWKRNEYVWIGFLEKQKDQENVSRLIDLILSSGYGVACPSPSTRMQTILKVNGFARTEQPYYMEPFKNEWSKHYCERKDIWTKGPGRA